MPYIKDKGKRHYINHFCRMVQSVGEIGTLIHVNNHIFNTMSPEDMAIKIAELKEAIQFFEQRYAEEFDKIPTELEH